MIRKKIYRGTRLMVMVVAFWAVLSPAAYADIDVRFARIVRLGIDPRFEGAMVQLEDTAASPKWTGVRQFYLSSTLGNQGLATMLTAFSLDENVWVRIAGTGEPGSLIMIIFVNAPAP
jgi:hypothetical protein